MAMALRNRKDKKERLFEKAKKKKVNIIYAAAVILVVAAVSGWSYYQSMADFVPSEYDNDLNDNQIIFEEQEEYKEDNMGSEKNEPVKKAGDSQNSEHSMKGNQAAAYLYKHEKILKSDNNSASDDDTSVGVEINRQGHADAIGVDRSESVIDPEKPAGKDNAGNRTASNRDNDYAVLVDEDDVKTVPAVSTGEPDDLTGPDDEEQDNNIPGTEKPDTTKRPDRTAVPEPAVTVEPTVKPTVVPTVIPVVIPTVIPTVMPTSVPTHNPDPKPEATPSDPMGADKVPIIGLDPDDEEERYELLAISSSELNANLDNIYYGEELDAVKLSYANMFYIKDNKLNSLYLLNAQRDLGILYTIENYPQYVFGDTVTFDVRMLEPSGLSRVFTVTNDVYPYKVLILSPDGCTHNYSGYEGYLGVTYLRDGEAADLSDKLMINHVIEDLVPYGESVYFGKPVQDKLFCGFGISQDGEPEDSMYYPEEKGSHFLYPLIRDIPDNYTVRAILNDDIRVVQTLTGLPDDQYDWDVPYGVEAVVPDNTGSRDQASSGMNDEGTGAKPDYDRCGRTITIPKTVTYIDNKALEVWDSFNVDGDNEHYMSEDGILYDKDKSRILNIPLNVRELDISVENMIVDIPADNQIETINITASGVEFSNPGLLKDKVINVPEKDVEYYKDKMEEFGGIIHGC